MAYTPRMGWPFPDQFEEGWYNKITAFAYGADASAYADAENANTLVMGGGTFTFSASGDLVTWTAAVEVNTSASQFLLSIPTGSITLLDNQWLYFLMPRNLRQNATGSFLVATSVTPSTGLNIYDYIAFARRRGNTLYFRNGLTLGDGESGKIFEFSPAIAGATSHAHLLQYFDLTGGETFVTLSHTSPQLIDIRFHRGGVMGVPTDDYTIVLATGVVTFSPPGVVGTLNERIVIDKLVSV